MIMPIEFEREVEDLQRQLAQVDSLTSTAPSTDPNTFGLLLFKRDNLRIKMYQEPGHNLPHIHIDYGHKNHAASYAINPVGRLAGALNRKYESTITEWISSRKGGLLDLIYG